MQFCLTDYDPSNREYTHQSSSHKGYETVFGTGDSQPKLPRF